MTQRQKIWAGCIWDYDTGFIGKIDVLLISRRQKGWIIYEEGLNEMFDNDG